MNDTWKGWSRLEAPKIEKGYGPWIDLSQPLYSDMPRIDFFPAPRYESLGLAPLLVLEVYAKVTEIQQLGMAVLLVEQNVPLTLEAIDRGYVIENGKVVLSGSADELKNNPAVKEAYLGI